MAIRHGLLKRRAALHLKVDTQGQGAFVSVTTQVARLLVVRMETSTRFPLSAGILFGLGLGGFFDGIVLHQVLQWHHMLTSAGLPADTVQNMRINVFWDGIFHLATYGFVVAGLAVLWRRSRLRHLAWCTRDFIAALLIGFGAFNLMEGLVDHHWLGLHHVNETVPPSQWIWWDLGFLAWGAAMLAGGLWLWRHADPASRSATADISGRKVLQSANRAASDTGSRDHAR